MEINNINQVNQLTYLVGIDLGNEEECAVSMRELAELVKTAGGEVFDCMIQKRNSIDPRLLIGSGKLLEIKQIMEENDIGLAVFDIELSPTQLNNISKFLGVDVIDRTILILDIFALRARTKEGKLQVEYAQLKHSYNRLKGKGTVLSRLGGGIGTRGPGETQLETDKRHIRRRMDKIESDLKKVETQRSELRKFRDKKNFLTVSLVGYTNSGKSTLFNALTNSSIFAEDMLFATLDPTSRRLSFDDGNYAMLVDTVGFIRKLPHFLINAFKATLEEVVLSDLVLLVCDLSDKDFLRQQEITMEILDELGYKGKILKVYNKIDKDSENLSLTVDGYAISAKEGIGIIDLKNNIKKELFGEKITVKLKIPYEKQNVLSSLRAKKCIIKEIFEENYEIVQITIDKSQLSLYNEFITNAYSPF